ncbi:MAG: TetR/AcrR family transcriptional regulator [Acidobacteria bacterium]|nr:TetR/AcrR family transcriptional regulator [Acidobacteriota bacterium]MCA1609698.1 TetR/AcrR family transcriptional regulator [Acidobacteriota bacterium]
MGKGEQTRDAILDHAMRLASKVGLAGLSIGRLAADLEMSKSGLFAHFQSKETLQVQVLDRAGALFAATVVRPALAAPRGERRLRALFERWLDWTKTAGLPGGCLFVTAAVELDDRPGPVRDRLVALQKEWLDVIARVARTGIPEGHFAGNLDPDQLAHDLYAVMLGYHHAARLLRDPRAADRARAGFESLLTATRARRSA